MMECHSRDFGKEKEDKQQRLEAYLCPSLADERCLLIEPLRTYPFEKTPALCLLYVQVLPASSRRPTTTGRKEKERPSSCTLLNSGVSSVMMLVRANSPLPYIYTLDHPGVNEREKVSAVSYFVQTRNEQQSETKSITHSRPNFLNNRVSAMPLKIWEKKKTKTATSLCSLDVNMLKAKHAMQKQIEVQR